MYKAPMAVSTDAESISSIQQHEIHELIWH